MTLGNNSYGIDLGTSNIKIYSKTEDEVLVEKNMIAFANKKQLFAYGNSAFEMYEKAPSNIQISYPLNNGVIADIKNMELLLKSFMNDLMHNAIKPADYYVAVPWDVTEVEKRAFYDLVKESGIKAKKIMIVEKSIADGLGMDIDVKNAQGVLVVNVGFDTTEISILSLGGVVISKLITVGGRQFDEAIRDAVRKEYSLVIGAKTAEHVKVQLKELEKEGKAAIVYGRDIRTGLPVEREIPPSLVNDALKPLFSDIIDNVKVILERTPPELAADIYRHGIYVTGGASQVAHFNELLSTGTGLNVNSSENPIASAALGLAKIIKDDNYKSLAYTAIEGMGK